MISTVNAKEKKYVALFSIFAFIILSAATIIFSFKKAYLEVEIAATNFTQVLLNNFYTNENVADATSVRYLQYKTKVDRNTTSTGFVLEHDPENNIKGINISDNLSNPDFIGTLQITAGAEDQVALNVAKSIDYIFKTFGFGNNYKNRFHYFYDRNERYIYLTRHTPTSQYVFVPSRASNFKIFGVHPEYIVRKFTRDPLTMGITSTEIYTDQLTKKASYSVVSYVYDLSDVGSEKILGAIMLDYTAEDLHEIFIGLSSSVNEKYVSAKVISNDSGKEIFFLGDREHSCKIAQKLSAKYQVEFSIDFWLFLLHDRLALISLIASFILSLATYFLCFNYLKKSGNENITDHLTKSFNRKALELVRTPETGETVSVAITDCNKFKHINDTYGHDTGDKALVFLSQVILSNIRRSSDVLIRLGGDEFCIIFKGMGSKGAQECMRRINRQIKTFRDDIPLSISWGVVEIKRGEDVYEAINRADIILYENKKNEEKVSC